VRRSILLIATAMAGLAMLPFPQSPASAACAPPYLKSTGRLVLERGVTVMVEGRAFVDGCRDSMSCSSGLGCDSEKSCEYADPPPTPMKDVELRLVQRDRTWILGVADAATARNDRLGWVTWTFELPADAATGPARLAPEHAQPLRIQIR
jgi:hypothetical protein